MPLKRQRNAASSDPMVGRVRSREVHPNRVRPGVGEGSTLVVAGGDFRAPVGRSLWEGFGSDKGRSGAG
jgi:hypothetical protein